MNNEILSAGDQRKLTAITLLDLSKAFDKLQDVRASHSSTQWFCSYLSRRHQVISIHSAVVEPLHLVSGVPQGSILGPHLLSIYVHDRPSVARKCS